MENSTQINGIFSPWLQKFRIKKALLHIIGNKILDVGSSNGELLDYLSPKIEYLGIEGNKRYFKNAKAKYPEYKFVNMYIDGENTNEIINYGKRDTIFMLAVIEHLNYPEHTLKIIKKCLSNKGVIIITTPNSNSKNILHVGSKLGLFTNEMHEHKNHFSKKELEKVINKAELNIKYYECAKLSSIYPVG